jgi:hypothetical protein
LIFRSHPPLMLLLLLLCLPCRPRARAHQGLQESPAVREQDHALAIDTREQRHAPNEAAMANLP